jgi:hypothetical protein
MEISLKQETVAAMRSFAESLSNRVKQDLPSVKARLGKNMRLAAMARGVPLSCHSRESGNPSTPRVDSRLRENDKAISVSEGAKGNNHE